MVIKTNSDLVIDGGNYIGTGVNKTGWYATYYNFIESTGGNIDIKKGNLECRDLLNFTGDDSASRKITIREDATTNGRIMCSNYSEDKVSGITTGQEL